MWWSMEIMARYFIMIFMPAGPCSIACLTLGFVFQNHAGHTLVVLHRHAYSPGTLLRLVSTKNWQNWILDLGPTREFDI